MLILTRRRGEAIVIGDNIQIRINKVRGSYIDIGIQAPADVGVHRQEIYEKIQQEKERRNEFGGQNCPFNGDDNNDDV